jgi:membrane-bound metal-dependent hydrolase YbcI (DUF457 family)
MDIITHAGIGLVEGSPFLADRPELALGIIAGSVLPDLDSLCRLRGKMPFLRLHQTWSHALPVQLLFIAATALIAAILGLRAVELSLGLFAGLLGHSLLDLTNTYGVAWLAPFSRRRFCLEWVFFIDATILVALVITLAAISPMWIRDRSVPSAYAEAFVGFLALYVISKGTLRRRAGRICPNSKSLVPSALVPWRFYGTMLQNGHVSFLQVNTITGACRIVGGSPILDDAFVSVLNTLPEFQIMRENSSEYHVVSASAEEGGMRLLCRDLRIRNFKTRFGDLEVWLDPSQHVSGSRFYV